MSERIEELLQSPFLVIDVLPEQVPVNSPGQYFAVERYFLSGARLSALKRKHADLILKLNCYRTLSLDGESAADPSPEEIVEAVLTRHVCVLLGDSMIVSEPDATHLTLYHPDDRLLVLIRILAAGEGLYVWDPNAGTRADSPGETTG